MGGLAKRRAEKLPALLLALLAPLAPATAAADHPPALRPYTAQYDTTARGFELSITRKLEAEDDGRFVLTSGGRILVVGFQEISVFRIETGKIRSISYVYQGTGLVSRRQELHFAADSGIIKSLYKDQWYELPYAADTLDRMSQLEQLRLALLQDPAAARDLILRVADGKRLKDSHLVLIGNETLQTPLGAVDTVHYERLHDTAKRKSDFWFAPAWDYLMVRTVHVEAGDPVEMNLTSATIDGAPVGTR
jgi:hypothetical protein